MPPGYHLNSGSFRNSDGKYPFVGDMSLTKMFGLMILLTIPWYLTSIYLDPIPRGEPVSTCYNEQDFNGNFKDRVCGYTQTYGWPFRVGSDFNTDSSRLSPSFVSAPARILSWNQILVLAGIFGPFILYYHIYWNRELEKSKNIIRKK